MATLLTILNRNNVQELPSFSGENKREWPYFEEVYKSTTIEGRYSDKENVARLRKALKGEAYHMVSDRLKYSSDADAIMDSLRTMFGRSGVLVHDLTAELLNLPKLSSKCDPKLRIWAVKVNGFVADLKSMNKEEDLTNGYVLTCLASRLGASLYQEWQKRKSGLLNVSIQQFAEFLTEKVIDLPPDLLRVGSEQKKAFNKTSRVLLHQPASVSTNDLCYKCSKKKHVLSECDEFLALTPVERQAFAQEKSICFTCLNPSRHQWKVCAKKRSCGTEGCSRRHHSLLHTSANTSSTELNSLAVSFVPQPHIHSSHVGFDVSILFKIVPIRIYGNGDLFVDTYAFLDDGSSLSMVDEELFHELGLNGQSEKLTLQWTKGVSRVEDCKKTTFSVSGIQTRKRYVLQKVYTIKNLGLASQSIDVTHLKSLYPHLRGLPLVDLVDARPKILLGLDQAKFLLGRSQRHGKDDEPHALKTLLGWIVYGRSAPSMALSCLEPASKPSMRVMFHEAIREEADLHELVRHHFTTEEFGVMAPKGEFVSREAMPELRRKKNWPRVWYAPTFIIVNPNKSPPKPRCVADVAAKVNGVSLNTYLSKGPDNLVPLHAGLFKFREREVAVNGDVREMFHRIRIKAEDQQCQRILWRDGDTTRQPIVYIMEVMMFGPRCSPSCAQYVKNVHANRFKAECPEAVDGLTKRTYVDDYFNSHNSMEEAVKVTRDALRICLSINFDLVGIQSNSRDFLQQMPEANVNPKLIKVPRRYSLANPDDCKVSLIVFVDASEQAFAAVAYLRFAREDEVQVTQVMAKARVAPVKQLTIPRLELQAAVLGVRLAATIKASHTIRMDESLFLSDSKTVLAWINSSNSKLPSFVASKIGEILDSTSPREWFHVGSIDNVADDGTKRFDVSMGNQNTRWFKGPEFLKRPFEDWPVTTYVEKADIKTCITHLHTYKPKLYYGAFEMLSARFQTRWCSSVRAIAFLLRFKHFLQRRPIEQEAYISPFEFRKAEEWMFRKIQGECFSLDIASLRSGGMVSSSSSLLSLSPFLDEDGTLRLSSRAQKANSSYSSRNPAILPNRHPLVDLFIEYHHKKNSHIGTETVISDIRESAWIISIRSTVERVRKGCFMCKYLKTKPIMPIMGQLPEARLAFDCRPFTHVGVDCFGPMVWLNLVEVRAVQIEVLNDLSLDQCTMAVRRFVINRVVTRFFYSDNGLNFVGTKNLLEKDAKEMENSLCEYSSSIDFVLKGIVPREDVLRNALTEAQGQLNRRPLTYNPVDPEDPKPLTPNSMLFGVDDRDVTAPGVFSDSDCSSRFYSRRSQYLMAELTRRWYKEYLPTITRRSKWFKKKTKPVEVNDVVIVIEPNEIRSAWHLGRVIQVYAGPDGVVRMADVKLSNGSIKKKRSVGRLAVLDLESSPTSQTAPGMSSSP
ncbi:uncharacterized protein LOC129905140 [Episyrphus balteatus]|uniref:uncharacterized protein LOC129905140 n=1 Tax=Episyrphus balteatus TaxID=286459 RepID=UPI0024861EDB|nr:uncharacterized protein LOC129905140 [Episyrphus balteatus]